MSTTTLLIVAGCVAAGFVGLAFVVTTAVVAWWFWPRATAQTKAAKHQADVARELFEAGEHSAAKQAFGFAVQIKQGPPEQTP